MNVPVMTAVWSFKKHAASWAVLPLNSKKKNIIYYNSTANFVMNKVVGDVICNNFCLKKFPKKHLKRGRGSKNENSCPWSKLNEILYT